MVSIKASLRRGVGYTAAGQVFSLGIRFVSTLILTRLLAPDLFGVMAFGATFVYAVVMLTDVGLRNALMQGDSALGHDYRNAISTLIYLRGLAIGLVLLGTTALLLAAQSLYLFKPGSVAADPRLLTAIPLLALAEIIRWTESIEIFMRERALDFRAMFWFQNFKQLVNTATTVVWAAVDPGIVSLCAGSVVAAFLGAIGSHLWFPAAHFRFVWNVADFQDILRQSKWVLTSSLLTFLVNTMDKSVLAFMVDGTAMGLYAIALTLGLLASELIARLGAAVVYPVLSRRSDAPGIELRDDYYRTRRPLENIALASGLVLIGLGQPISAYMYDARYAEVGLLLQVFGVSALPLAHLGATDAFNALGKVNLSSIVHIIRLAALILGLAILVPQHGALGAAMAVAAANISGAMAGTLICRHLELFSARREVRFLGLLALVGLVLALLQHGQSLLKA